MKQGSVLSDHGGFVSLVDRNGSSHYTELHILL